MGPPLFASEPSKGLVLLFEPEAEPQPQVVLLSMLLPPLAIALLQFPPDVLLARWCCEVSLLLCLDSS